MDIGHTTRGTYVPVAPATRSGNRQWHLWVKRGFDIVVSVVGLILLSPLLLVIAVVIKLDSPGAVIYRQQRVRGDQDPKDPHPETNTFTFYKFRSMYQDADQRTHRQYVTEFINGNHKAVNNGHANAPIYKMTRDKRVTRVGRVLRRTSLDELPQLVNVLKGEMSLVGPRPAVPYEVAQYQEWHRERLAVTPGITGLWQVSGRSRLTFKEMVTLDIEYARNYTLALDLHILLKTIPAVLSSRGAW
jgi:lipopolysaccharide/colanic/teichoic acid biosynthesis glycosyltransferase